MKRWILLCLCLLAAGVRAEDEGHVRFLKYEVHYFVNEDATYTALQEVSYRVLTEAALVNSGKMPISYNSKLEDVQILEAYTLKPDGRRIDVAPAGIQTQQGQLASGYGISQVDQRTLMITFPQLEAGDAVVYKYRQQQKEAVFPGQFYASGLYAPRFAWDAVDVTIDMPSSLPLKLETEKMTMLPVEQRDNRHIYRWQARNLPIVQPESGAVDLFATTPHFTASTFVNWRQFAAAYEARAKEKAKVTPAIAAIADVVTQGLTDQRAQTKALYDWVAKNIRYVASWAGAGGWVPHDAESVLQYRYGDCKDHVVLLESLLAAKGIASTTVMINSDKSSYSLPTVVYPAFNHVITYVPALDLYMDSTAGTTTPFGVLPVTQADKPVIHTAAEEPVRRTPMLDPAMFSAHRTTRLTLTPDGDANGEFILQASGPAAIDLREIQQSIGRRKEAEWVREFLHGQNLEGDGQVDFAESADGKSVSMRLSVRIRNYLAIAENGIIPLAPILTGPIAFDHLFGVHKRYARTQPYWCPAWLLDDRYEIRVPDNFKLIVPKSRDLTDAGFAYSSRYEVQGGVLMAERRLAIERRPMACRPQEYQHGKAAVAQIERAVRAQVIYQVQ